MRFQKNIKDKYGLIIVTIFTLIISTSFQVEDDDDSGGYFGYLAEECQDINGYTPLKLLRKTPFKCTTNATDNFLSLMKAKSDYVVSNLEETNQKKSWYNNEIHSWKSKFLPILAIVTSDFELIHAERYGKDKAILLLGGILKNNYAIWGIAVNLVDENGPHYDVKLVDLQAGDISNQQFASYLSDQHKFNHSRIPEIIEKWEESGFKKSFTVRSILPDECGNSNITISEEPTDEEFTKFFNPLDLSHGNQPLCISQAIGTRNKPFAMLTEEEESGRFHVWKSSKKSEPQRSKWYDGKSENFKNSARIGWFTLAKINDCVLYDIENSTAYISICGDTIIQAFKSKQESDKFDFYTPLELLDKKDQRELCIHLKKKQNFERSPIKELTLKWLNEIGNPKYKIVSFFDERKINISQEIKGQLKTELGKHFQEKYYLVQNKVGKDYQYRKYKGKTQGDLSSWYTHDIHQLKNPYIGKLALAKGIDVKIKEVKKNKGSLNETIFSFVINKGHNYDLLSWKLDKKNPSNLMEYGVFNNLYDNTTDRSIANEYAKAVGLEEIGSKLFDKTIKQLIDDYFADKERRLIQVYPKNNQPKGDNPLSLLGTAVNDKIIIPSALQKAFDQKEELHYLIEENKQFNIYNSFSKRIHQDIWINQVQSVKNPWVAWLSLVDPNMELIATNVTNSSVRLCMITRQARKDLWSWVFNASEKYPPSQFHLIKKEETFLLTKKPLSSYVERLPEEISESERNFYLSMADKPSYFTLLDLLKYSSTEANRVLLWRQNNLKTKELFRVGKGLDQNKSIKANLVEGVWDGQWISLSKRYQKTWYREEFKKHIAKRKEQKLEAWFGINRLGLLRGEQVGVFLGTGNRDFSFTLFREIDKLIDDMTLIPKKEKVSSLNVFFDAVTREDWKETESNSEQVWRANPIGFFDRLNMDD